MKSSIKIASQFVSTRLIISVMALSLLGGIGYLSTSALFRDVEESNKGVFLVGTLDLELGQDSQDSVVVTNVGGDQETVGAKAWRLHNAGSLPGQLRFHLNNVRNFENNCNEPEALVDTSCSNPGEGEGELGAALATTVKVKVGNQDEKTITTADLATASQAKYQEDWIQLQSPIVIPPGGNATVTLAWQETNFGNEVQGDSVQFDAVFELEQLGQTRN